MWVDGVVKIQTFRIGLNMCLLFAYVKKLAWLHPQIEGTKYIKWRKKTIPSEADKENFPRKRKNQV